MSTDSACYCGTADLGNATTIVEAGGRRIPVAVVSSQVFSSPASQRRAKGKTISKTISQTMDENCLCTTYFLLGIGIFACFVLSVVLGGVSLSYYETRTVDWAGASCTVTSQRLLNYTGPENVNHYKAEWNVTYWNSIASRLLNGTVTQLYPDLATAQADLQIYFPQQPQQQSNNVTDTGYQCWFRRADFLLDWNLPFDNYDKIGWTAVAFVAMLLLLICLLCFIRFAVL